MRRTLLAGLLLLGTMVALPAAADIIVLTSGYFLKVDGYELGESSILLQLPVGGTMTLSLANVERIIDDELATGEPGHTFDLDEVVLDFAEGQPLPETQYAEMFYEVGRKYEINPRLLASIAQAESDFEPWARSEKGAIGIMQVMPATAERFGVDPGQLYDPLTCMDVGARYLSVLRDRFDGDVVLMLAAYNAGEATVDRFGGVPPYIETQTYIRRVHRSYSRGPG